MAEPAPATGIGTAQDPIILQPIQVVSTQPSSQAQKKGDLPRQICRMIASWKTSTRKPPFSMAEMVVMCLVLEGEQKKQDVHFWILTNFGYYGRKALHFVSTINTDSRVWNLKEKATAQLEAVFRALDTPVHHKRNGIDDPEDDSAEHWATSRGLWAVNSLGEARIFLRRHFVAPVSTAFRFLDLPAELRLKIYELALCLPKSGISVSSGRVKELVPLSKNYNQPFKGFDRLPNFSTSNWRPPLSFLHCAPPASHLALLQVSKQVFEEAMPVFFGDNLFVFNSLPRMRDFLDATPKIRRNNISRMAFPIEVRWKSVLPKVTKVLATLTHLKELDIWIDEKDFKSEQKITAAFPGYHMPGFTALRTIRGLKAVRFHGDCPDIKKALEGVVTTPKNVKPKTTRKRKPVAPAEANKGKKAKATVGSAL
ncbi:hypothetical protein BST61_g9836 [Cercospora zeina]